MPMAIIQVIQLVLLKEPTLSLLYIIQTRSCIRPRLRYERTSDPLNVNVELSSKTGRSDAQRSKFAALPLVS